MFCIDLYKISINLTYGTTVNLVCVFDVYTFFYFDEGNRKTDIIQQRSRK